MNEKLPRPSDMTTLDAPMSTLEEIQDNLATAGLHGLAGDIRVARATLQMGLEIWDEYMSQIGACCSQDYGRLNEFPMWCKKLGVELKEGR